MIFIFCHIIYNIPVLLNGFFYENYLEYNIIICYVSVSYTSFSMFTSPFTETGNVLKAYNNSGWRVFSIWQHPYSFQPVSTSIYFYRVSEKYLYPLCGEQRSKSNICFSFHVKTSYDLVQYLNSIIPLL